MTLPIPHSDRFYNIWKPLLLFVNRQRQLVPALLDVDPGTKLNLPDVFRIRQAIWEDDALLDTFVVQNPAHLSAEDLSLVASWKHHRAGRFFVFKHLKKHSIFIDDGRGEVFAVKGLYSSIEEVVGPYLPVLVETVLLPFGDEIIYDSLMQPYNISFGSGIRGNLNAIYNDAKERGAVLTALKAIGKPLSPADQAAQATSTNAKVLQAFQKHLYHSGQSVKIVERDLAMVAAFASQTLPLSLREITENNVSDYLASLPAASQGTAVTGFKRFVKFLRETGRLDWDEAENLLLVLKGSVI
jgi:hypothetical protein